MKLIILVILAVCRLVNSYNPEKYTEDYCETQSGGDGTCVLFQDCQPLIDLATKKNRTPEDIDLIKKSKCKYGYDPFYVCCPDSVSKIKKNHDVTCNTPEGKSGVCIALKACPHLANSLQPPVDPFIIKYLKESRCEGPEQFSVCCGPPLDLSLGVVVGNCENRISAIPPDPFTRCCGLDNRVGNKIVLGNVTSIDDYPWLVIIEYVKGTTKYLNCGGTLISGKYVLTAGHCVVGPQLKGTKPVRVRLGEYDIAHGGRDCVEVDIGGGEDCTHGVTSIEIEEIIPYPEYNPVGHKRHDIALIRLKEKAPFTDFIRPICLPQMDLTLPQNLPGNFTPYVAGWGAINDTQQYSQLKMHVQVPYVELSKCQRSYTNRRDNITLWEGQLCAGGDGRDACRGDSGGPLMFDNGYYYEIIGVVSFGQYPCGRIDTPGVFTKVYHYLDWIKSNIVP